MPKTFPIESYNTNIYKAQWEKNIITVTITGDDGVDISTPNVITVDKGSKWAEIKKKAISKVTPKESKKIKEWRLNNADGILLEDETLFEESRTVFAISRGGDYIYNKNGVGFTMKTIYSVTNTVLGDDDQSDNKEHTVSLTEYCIGETEVTQDLWISIMGSNPSKWTNSTKNPVEKVTWYECVDFCNKLTIKEMGEEHCVYKVEGNVVHADFKKKGFRLPTEAEWEYAAMGGQKYKYAGCDLDNELEEYAWFADNSGDKTHEVKTRKANKYGLYDMSGNVMEWCWDLYSDKPSSGEDPTGATSGDERTYRGGNFFDTKEVLPIVIRNSLNPPNAKSMQIGLRLANRP